MTVFLLAAIAPAPAQEIELPSLSPRAEVMQEIGVVEARVSYARPGKRGRTIWGDLVPYDELWRTGANRATTIEVSAPVQIGNAEIEAGTYAIFTIPREGTWAVILNGNPDQSGTGRYDEALDVARLQIAPVEGEAVERLTFQFTDVTDTSASLDLVWDGVKVQIPITVDTGRMVDASVDRFVSGAARRLAQTARHYARNGEGDKAVEAADTAVRIDESWYTLWSKAEALEADGERRQAIRFAKKARKKGDDSAAEGSAWFTFYRERVQTAITEW